MQSKITGGDTTPLFTARIMGKYNVAYYRCNDTGFIQTEEPYWLNEAYNEAITKLDIGLSYRNIELAEKVSRMLVKYFNYTGKKFLDYAGGYGLFTRLMRDKGFDFYHTDEYCKNLFAEYFELADLPPGTHFEMTTAFEVFEHLPSPLPAIGEILKYADNLLFSTELQPNDIAGINSWWYFSPETGQHVSFYNEKTLKYIAGHFGFNFYTDGRFLHLFTKATFNDNPLIVKRDKFFLRKAKKFVRKRELEIYTMPASLLGHDHDKIKAILNSKNSK